MGAYRPPSFRRKALLGSSWFIMELDWKDWNGYSASVGCGIGKLVHRCINQVNDPKLQCGLRTRCEALRRKVLQLSGSTFQCLDTKLNAVACRSNTRLTLLLFASL